MNKELCDYIKSIKTIPRLPKEEELNLAKDKTTQNVNKLVNANLWLVVYIAKKYIGLSLPFSDLIQEGNTGLMHAVYHYDPNRGARLSTYSCYWIHKYIRDALKKEEKNREIYVDMDIDKLDVEKLDIDDSTDSFRQIILTAEIDDALEELTEKERKIVEMNYGLKGEKYTLKQIAEIMGISRETVRKSKNKALEKLKNSKLRDLI